MSEITNAPHPGTRIRAEVIPQGMSVTKAAQLMGVGRPALSNLLNGNSALSADMATRLEKAFSYSRKDLLEMQANYDAAQARNKDTPTDIKAFVPKFLDIKANQIEQWATHNIPARARLSVLLRTLIHSTGRALTKVDFPGNDDAERPGWDGFVEADEGTPWVPAGFSGWEFGTNENIKTKADKDFDKSTRALEQKERQETTFVFVTPRRWIGKTLWIEAAKAKTLWKDVRAYDASDLEQWLEQSLPGQSWLASEINIPTQGVRSLDKCWIEWANASTPPLPGALFSTAIEVAKGTMLSRLSNPLGGPTIITADSAEEALAFLSQLLGERGGEELATYRDRVLVLDKPGVLPRLAEGAHTFIPVVFTREVERELAVHARSMHAIVVYPRNANIEPHIILEPANWETFQKALEGIGKDRDEITRLANASGRSLTVLRRQLSIIPAVRMPEWATDHKTATSLVPFLFVGAWHSTNDADKLALSLLAGDRPYDELEKECQSLSHLNDAPIWSVGTYRGVISKIDLLYAIASAITPEDLKRYFSMARMVLGEDDPALDLEEDERWAASIHGKTREFSGSFREGISETLVLLAVHGGHLFRKRLGIDTEIEALRVVRDLLPTPLTTRILEANDHDLPTYAEAAPDEFLSIIERDMMSASPAALGLLRPVDNSVFGRSPSRTGLLWALEGLSWSPETLPRAVFILARLAQVEIKDNWVNKPMHSLESIFRVWMPQTEANHDARLRLMKKLAERFPSIAWKICVAQIGVHHEVGHYNHKPRWRKDGYGFGEPFPTWDPVFAFMREMVDMALNWREEHSLDTLSDLVERLRDLSDDHQARVWSLVETWARDTASDADKAAMREKIRISTLSRRAVLRARKGGPKTALTEAAKLAYAALEPANILNKHAWLFSDTWIEESADEIEEIEKLDFRKREERIQRMRVEAMREVLAKFGCAGLLKLAEAGKASWQIGVLAAQILFPEEKLQEFLQLALQMVLANETRVRPYENLIAGALRAIDDNDKRERLLMALADGMSEERTAVLLVLAPFRKSTWKLVDALGKDAQAKYWQDVVPNWIHEADDENNQAVERLLKADRPRAAFSCISLEPTKIDAQVLFRLLSEIAKGGGDRPSEYKLEQYHVEQAFKHLNASSVLTVEQKAGLEFAFIEVLARPWDSRADNYGIPNLELYVETHPELFVQAVVWAYKRKDGGEDPAHLQVPPERLKDMAERGHKLLDSIERIPGHDNLGVLKPDRLGSWIATVRRSCGELSRADVADLCLGKLLSHAPAGEDGVWPSEPVRQVLEEIQSDSIMQGVHIGVYNSRGAHWRGEGGDQERELANKYRPWSQALQYSHPYVASKLLMRLVKTYEREASREDTEAGIRRRLR